MKLKSSVNEVAKNVKENKSAISKTDTKTQVNRKRNRITKITNKRNSD